MASAGPRKKRNREKLVVEFDEDARRDFLTSFSKRKQERRKKALRDLEARAKQERLSARKEFRDQLVSQKREEVSTLLENRAKIEQEEEKEQEAEVVKALATDKEKVDQIVDDFSAHAFGSAMVTVTTTVPLDDEAEAGSANKRLADDVAKAYVSRLPKNSKIAITDTERQATRLRDKLKKKKKGHNHSQNQQSGAKKKGGGKRK